MRIPLLALSGLFLLGPATGQGLDTPAVQGAIEGGLGWLVKQHQADGTFAAGMAQGPNMHERAYPMGRVALGVFTMLKCGIPGKDPRLKASFAYLAQVSPKRTYGVAMYILALEARYAPSAEELQEKEKRGYTTLVRRGFAKRASPQDKQKLQELVNWLVEQRHQAVWRYPGPAQDGAQEDNSNAQYALLALKGARRLGAKVPKTLFAKVADYFLAQQDPQGEEVPWFSIPAADGPIRDRLSPAKREKLLRKLQKEREKKKERGGTSERGKGGGTLERARLYARGWSYLPRGQEGVQAGDFGNVSTGSMTASGVAALCIAKSELEEDKRAWAARQQQVNQAIRDGCAWLARHWTPTANPTAIRGQTLNWKYYYLYGVERAGVLAGTYRFGRNDWWDGGAGHLLQEQGDSGSWPEEQGLSSFCTTCFALLFLKRATVPLVPLPPKRVMTGVKRR